MHYHDYIFHWQSFFNTTFDIWRQRHQQTLVLLPLNQEYNIENNIRKLSYKYIMFPGSQSLNGT